MCVAIVKNAGVIIPPDMIETAALVNSDGWGLAIVDRGRVERVRHYDPAGNDPDLINKTLEELAEYKTYLHLRYMTRGVKNEENCHPYEVYADDEYQCMFMHNGTLTGFGSGDVSDSRDFTGRILRPLIDNALATSDRPLNEEYVQFLVKQVRDQNPSSRFVLMDNKGDDIILGSAGDSQWHEYGGDPKAWWSSNVYSFRATHRVSNSSYSWDARSKRFKDDEVKQNNAHPTKTATTSTASAITTGASKLVTLPSVIVPEVAKPVTSSVPTVTTSTATEVADTPASTFPKREKEDPEPSLTFCEVAGLDDIGEIVDYTPAQIREIIEDPDMGCLLFQDLVWRLWSMEVKFK